MHRPRNPRSAPRSLAAQLRVTLALAVPALALVLGACSSSASHTGIGDGEIAGKNTSSGGSPTFAPTPGPSAPPAGGSDSASGGAAGSDGTGSGSGTVTVPAGILTAGAWDDNRNFDLFLDYRKNAQSLAGVPPFTEGEHKDAFNVFGAARSARQTLDVALVIDTTGSMGDEMAYVQSEFVALYTTIQSSYPEAQQRWSLIFYKDVNDPYIVRYYDFDTDPQTFVSHFEGESAGGGDDYPESPERALQVASQMGWRTDDGTARLVFWITDAPHHDADASTMAEAIRSLGQLGVHIYPVAASGADDLTQLTMRSAAQLTGGRYLFLTDDSGVGDPHAVPLIPCFFVTKLNKAILRMVDVEMSGRYHEPDSADVIRTGGDPHSGRCTLSDGSQVIAF
jgi:hypothetical protein